MQDFEKLGVFYLGRAYDLATKKPREEDLILYDSKDLVTHAVCVGMTGSGKTGLCLTLLEEAAIDSIPALVIDPKGDISNLLLTFPSLKGADFEPWINTDDARKKGQSPKDFAQGQADMWKKGLAEWGQDGQRLQRLRDSADYVIYTPGSNAGIPVSILQSFDAPPEALRNDTELLRERINTTATSLLGLLDIEADPIQSREHILISTILNASWKAGKDINLPTLIAQIQNPPVARVGVLDLETFFPSKERFALAMQFNNLLASPSFEAWMDGVPLDIQSILYTPQGKPRIAIFSIAHLSESERMFFVALFLNQVLGWMRQQSGTTSLRALVYMDEIFGYFPPVKNPPTKTPMLTLLKQARAFGVGMVLATQNPVDIDYKGLSNCGTWFIGRLQTERDKNRVLDGLEGAASTVGKKFDRGEMERTIASLGNRVFLLHSVHEDRPAVFLTRWALRYLRGPVTRQHIKTLMDPRRAEFTDSMVSQEGARPTSVAHDEDGEHTDQRAILPPEVLQFFIPVRGSAAAGAELLYRPMLLGCTQLYFNEAKNGIELTQSLNLLTAITDDAVAVNWEESTEIDVGDEELEKSHAEGECLFASLPREAAKPKAFDSWRKALADHLYRNRKLQIFKSPALKEISKPGESEKDFRIRLQQAAREERDQKAEQLRQKYAPKIAALEERIRKALQTVEKEKEQSKQSKLSSLLNFASTIIGAFTGRKVMSATNVGKAATSVRSASKTMKESKDVTLALENVEAIENQKAALEEQFQAEVKEIEDRVDPMKEEFTEVLIRPKKTNITIRLVALAWLPYWKKKDGTTASAWE